MNKFTYNDIVKVDDLAPQDLKPGYRAWIVGISVVTDRRGQFLEEFPHGVVYTIEYEDGTSTEIHECYLKLESTEE